MSFKFSDARDLEEHNLWGLCEDADFDHWQDPNALRERHDALQATVQRLVSPVENVFYRALGIDGVELFVFQDERNWMQHEQTGFDGLSYFCFPNRERIEHEVDLTARDVFGLSVVGGKVYVIEGTPERGPIYLDRTFPDKWSHMALEILLRYAGRD